MMETIMGGGLTRSCALEICRRSWGEWRFREMRVLMSYHLPGLKPSRGYACAMTRP